MGINAIHIKKNKYMNFNSLNLTQKYSTNNQRPKSQRKYFITSKSRAFTSSGSNM